MRRPIPIATAIIDQLEADGSWVHIELLTDEVHQRYPHWKRDSIRRTAERLVDRGAVHKRVDSMELASKWRVRVRYQLADHWRDIVNEHETRGRKKSA